jgi:CubicO group peptidase (beta-lactamase class C family)
VVITQDDVIIAEKYFGKRPQVATVMSVTKSVTSLAVGALIEDGKIASLDVPVSTYYPEWAEGTKATATLRHLLTMTSGLVDDPTFFDQSDLLAFARAQPLAGVPGAFYAYSNESAMLFSGIVKQAAGMPIDQFVRERYFTPLGITDFTWEPDGAGNVQTPGGLLLGPHDLLRIGTLAKNGGVWRGKRLINAGWIGMSTENETPLEPCYGYLWWIVRDGCTADGPAAVPGSVAKGFFADGWGGNYIAVIPAAHVVAVRTKVVTPPTQEEEQKTVYDAFTSNAAALTR